MKNIKILGSGCRRCTQLAETTDQAAKALGIEYTLEKITDLNQIAAHGVLFTPALVVDGLVKFSGMSPPLEEIKKHLA